MQKWGFERNGTLATAENTINLRQFSLTGEERLRRKWDFWKKEHKGK
jgi:hypothetical protein